MTAPHIVALARLLDQAVSDASPDLIRHLLGTVINALLSADADAVCGGEYGQVSPDRVNRRNGYRHPRSCAVMLSVTDVIEATLAPIASNYTVCASVPISTKRPSPRRSAPAGSTTSTGS